MPHTILIDGFMLGKRFEGTGINRYLVNLLTGIAAHASQQATPQFKLLVPSARAAESEGWRPQPGFEVTSCPLMRYPRGWRYGLVNSITLPKRAGAVFLPSPALVYFKPSRLAVTIHDIIPLIFPEQYDSLIGKVFLHTYTTSMRNADLILTDSARSKADMVERFGVRAETIVVTHLGFDASVFHAPGPDDAGLGREMLARRGIVRPYVLHVGRAEPRKNLVRLVQAFESVLSRRPDLDIQLVLAGPLGWGCEPLLSELKQPSLEGRVVLAGRVPDSELSALYRSAACFAMPSLYEGFGLPALEAMASGTPLLSSNRSSLPEVAGEAALYFDPESVEEMSAAIERILTDSGLRERLVKKGLERARQFSWQQCASATLSALNRLF